MAKSPTACPNPSQRRRRTIYCNEFATFRKVLGETTALADLDFYCSYGCPASAPTNRFFQGQFSSLYAWSTIGTSSYNAGQFVLRHPMSHGFQGDLSYTFGNSIDIGSDAERSSEKQGGSGSYITNAWNPAQSRGVSDFDTRHLITANGSYLLPFGRGQAFGSHVKSPDRSFDRRMASRFHRPLDERLAVLSDGRWLHYGLGDRELRCPDRKIQVKEGL